MTSNEELDLVELLEVYNRQFDLMCQERHEKGSEKYGPGKFLTVDTLQEAIEEVIDLANYARYTFIKLRALQDKLPEILNEAGTDTTSGTSR